METNSLEQRLRFIEDRLAIYNLIASHPPSADTGADYYTAAVYAENGVFDRGENLLGAIGRDEIAAIVKTAPHQEAIAGGLAHFAGLPHVVIEGDNAVVTSYLQILVPNKTGEAIDLPNHGASQGYRIHRVVANRWELERESGVWKIRRRTLRPLDGSEPARALLRRALEAYLPQD